MASSLGTSKAAAPQALSIRAAAAQAQASGLRREPQAAHLANAGLAWPVPLLSQMVHDHLALKQLSRHSDGAEWTSPVQE